MGFLILLRSNELEGEKGEAVSPIAERSLGPTLQALPTLPQW